MIKIKTFVYDGQDIASYNQSKESMTGGRYRYDLDASKIDREINNFTKKHKVLSVTPMTFVKGNNPPVAIITFTVVYEEE